MAWPCLCAVAHNWGCSLPALRMRQLVRPVQGCLSSKPVLGIGYVVKSGLRSAEGSMTPDRCPVIELQCAHGSISELHRGFSK